MVDIKCLEDDTDLFSSELLSRDFFQYFFKLMNRQPRTNLPLRHRQHHIIVSHLFTFEYLIHLWHHNSIIIIEAVIIHIHKPRNISLLIVIYRYRRHACISIDDWWWFQSRFTIGVGNCRWRLELARLCMLVEMWTLIIDEW